MKKIYDKNSMLVYINLPLLIGVVAGSIFFLYLALHNVKIEDYGILKFSMNEVFSLTDIQLFVFLLKRRFCQFFLLFILLNILPCFTVIGSSCAFFGVYYGYVISQLFYQFSWKGIIYGMICFYPHFLCYGIGVYLLGKWFYYLDENDISKKRNVKKAQYIIKIFVIFFLLLFGLLWEIKFQKNILKIFYQYLVS